MPDNVTAPATGLAFATDEVAGVHFPYSKLAFGANGSAVVVADADGARLPVTFAEPPPRVLAADIGLTAGAAGTAITGVAAGSYIFEAVFTGSDLQLQRLGPNGTTWINAGTLAASGSTGVVLAAGDTIRLRNNSLAAIAGLWARVA